MVGYSADDYLRFSADKETIYYSEPVYACEDAYVLPTNDNSEQWGVRSDGHWTYVNCLMYSFPPQGWKIHITSTIYDAQNVLYDVAEYLFVKSISFKYLSSRTCFIQANGKYADRLESGKFITIYPSSEHIFIQLLKDLKTIVCKYDDGPYILTDKQWQNSNVFFRYGALKPRFSNEKNVPVIVTPQGDLIPDKELPLYSLPSFVDEPIYVKENNYLFESSDRFLAKEVPLYCPSNTAVMTSRSVDFPASLSPTTILIPGESSTCSLENLLNPNTRISFIYIAYPPDCLINYPLVYMDW
ncbi:hypothetical protein NE662_08115 [Bifidobacterium pseudocatenulatum]|uniref:class III lanthionine synthetase LanKC N-terminal domain-containing protein n=1 Tax=Bifidobacterium pseudocatenulatum TaxID=28026 RepID=UPI00210EC3BE|nr:hypothetical protein [Bifidobacterium pseudocatenulatum]MCQ4974199.1 hypothetical protein [Bifidobacterium pseudocatenulatum]